MIYAHEARPGMFDGSNICFVIRYEILKNDEQRQHPSSGGRKGSFTINQAALINYQTKFTFVLERAMSFSSGTKSLFALVR